MEKLMNSVVKNKILFNLFFILFSINILCSCKKHDDNYNLNSSLVEANQSIFKEVKNLQINNNYSADTVKSMDVNFQDYNFKIRYIEDRAYVQYSFGSKIIQDWQPFKINFYYDSSYEFAEKDIHLLYNYTISEGVLLIPSFTEEFPSYFLYKFDSNKIQYLKDIELNASSQLYKNGHYQAVQRNEKIIVNYIIKNQTEYKFVDRNDKPNIIIEANTKDDIRLLNGLKSENSDNITGLWQRDCSVQNSGIEISQNKNRLTGTLALAPPAIFINVTLEKGTKNNVYYLKYISQDMSPPMASENEIDEENISKKESIGKIVKNNEEFELTWYELSNIKTSKKTHIVTQFSSSENAKPVKLKKCEN
ncbi:hypothetical protein LNP04_10445 [Chryseobacterium sp. C-71]|uniref:hypothetical protein n=1 Tax=Chryseobacterium sp. C-71 TaxID=2893882 RepID=UPI001E571ED6|nr:hypothetical protein [Chryseobacterium sp. C-71]UFH30400.1 hypothetical protein LNP04_10445 [Chryseobacterium sp. C-71]